MSQDGRQATDITPIGTRRAAIGLPAMAVDRKARIHAVARVSSGNFLEMYDFQVFGYYVAAIARTFFPSGGIVAGLAILADEKCR